MDVKQFLATIKPIVNKGMLDIVPTEKNRITRRKLGLTVIDVEDAILSLTEIDLHKGPIVDRDFPNQELFIFKKQICDEFIYIKLKIIGNMVKCLSFHVDE
jgi:hypothetical protein